MKITAIYCHIQTVMHSGKPYAALMYTTIESEEQEKEYWKRLDPTMAGIAMYKLARAHDIHPKIRYNQFDDKLTSKEIVWYWEA